MHLPSDRRGWIKLAAVVAGLIGAYLLFKLLVPDLDPEELLEDVSGTLGKWTYALVGVLAFLETGAFVGLIAPGETFVVLAGAVAGQGDTNVLLTIAIVWASAFLGDTVSYLLGVKLGRGFILKHGPKLRISHERFAQVEKYFDKHGGKTILIGRFIGLVRALAPFIAGSSGMEYRRMAPYSVLGTGLWATTFTLLGFYASKNLDAVLDGSSRAIFAFAVFVGLVVGTIALVRYLRVEANRRRVARWMEARPVFRNVLAAGRRLSPQARFVAGRLTPGDLGLELTTSLAVLAVGSFVLIGYGLEVVDDPGPTAGDSTAADVVGDLRADWLTSIAEVVTVLGSTPVIALLGAVAAVWLGVRRNLPELAVLVVGIVALLIGPALIKELIDRPRPPESLVATMGNAYPSGHAAHSVIYTWIALTIALRLRPGMPRASLLVAAGVAITALVGLSRVYLGAHHLSDVSGGWAYGASVFALLSALAVVVTYLRHNADG